MNPKVKGFLLTAFSGCCFACASLFVKLATNVPISLVVLARAIFQTLSAVILNTIFWRNKLFDSVLVFILIAFGLLCFLTIYGIYLAFQTIPLGEATVILSTTPIFVSILDKVIYRTSISIPTVISAVLCCLGVVVLCVPKFTLLHHHNIITLLGYGVITFSTICQAASFIQAKHIDAHYVVLVFYLGVTNMILSFILAIPDFAVGLSCSALDYLWVFFVSIFAVAGSLGLNYGLQLEKAAVVALVRNIDIPVAYIFDVAVLHHEFNLISILGGVIIVIAIGGSSIYNVYYERNKEDIEMAKSISQQDLIKYSE